MACFTDDDFDNIMFEINEEYAGHTGKGAQSKAQEDGQYVIHCNPTVKGGIFYGYTTHEERAINATRMSNKGHDVNERINGCNPCKAFLDVDASADTTDEDLTDIAAALKAAIEELCPKESAIDIKEYGYDSNLKRSRHFISNVIVADGSIVAHIARTAKSFLPLHLANYIDVIGNIKSFGLRIPYCSKKGDRSRTIKLLYEPDDFNFWIQSDNASISKVSIPKMLEQQEELTLTCNALKLAKEIAINFPWFDTPVPVYKEDHPEIVAELNRLEPHYCTSCERVHERRNAYISVDENGVAFLRCYIAPKNSAVLASKGADLKVMPLDGYDILLEATHVNSRYNAESIPDNGRDLYISSAWCTGKSHHNVAIMNAAIAKNPNCKILNLSPRRSLSVQLAQDMLAVHYNKIKGILDTKMTPVSVWQLDSLARISCDEVFDLIYIDELTALTSHAYHGGNNPKARAGISSMSQLAKTCKRLIVSDNDLTTIQVQSFLDLRKDKLYTVYRNDFQPWAGIPANITSGLKSHAELEAQLWNRLNEQFALKTANEKWHGTVIPCHARKQADAIAIEARKRYGSDLVRLYTGETDDFIKAKDFANATESWANALVVIYTSTVSVGISCNLEHFDQVFAFFNGKNISAASSAQMLFRPRQVKCINIAYSGKKTYGLPLTREKVLLWVTEAERRKDIPDEFRHDRSPNIKIKSATDPKELDKIIDCFEGNLWMNAYLEQMRSEADFVQRISAILSRAGLIIANDKALPLLAIHPTPESNEEPLPLREVVMVEQIEAATERECDGLDPERNRTYEEKMGDKALSLSKTFHVEHTQLTPEWIVEYEPHVEVFKRFERIINKTVRNPEVLKTASEGEGCTLAINTLKELNFDINLVQTGHVISLDRLKTVATSLSETINAHALRLYGDTHSARRKKAVSNFRSWCGILAVPLKYIGIGFEPTYKTKNDKKEGRNPTGATIMFIWDVNPISPRPLLSHLSAQPLFGLDDLYN
jgi:hypothetical protein